MTTPGDGTSTGENGATEAVFECLRLLARAPFRHHDVDGAMAVLSSQADQIAGLGSFPFATRSVIVPRSVYDWLLDAAAQSFEDTDAAQPRLEPGASDTGRGAR
jgi:hypothetical protein